MVLGMVFPGMGRNPFIYLWWITNNVCLAIMLTKHSHSFLPTTISPSHHHQPCLSLPPTMLVTTTTLHDCPQTPMTTNDHSTTTTSQKMKMATHKLQPTPTPRMMAWTHEQTWAVTSPGESTCPSLSFISFIQNTGAMLQLVMWQPNDEQRCWQHCHSLLLLILDTMVSIPCPTLERAELTQRSCRHRRNGGNELRIYKHNATCVSMCVMTLKHLSRTPNTRDGVCICQDAILQRSSQFTLLRRRTTTTRHNDVMQTRDDDEDTRWGCGRDRRRQGHATRTHKDRMTTTHDNNNTWWQRYTAATIHSDNDTRWQQCMVTTIHGNKAMTTLSLSHHPYPPTFNIPFPLTSLSPLPLTSPSL